jgi:orsellinic acid C2-O-methyltransferase
MASEEKVTPPALPPQIVLYQMATGHYLSRALDLAATLGIADRLKDGPRPVGELAQATATHAPSLHRVLRLLASAGVLVEQADGAFGLTPIGECLRTDTPGSAHAMVKLFAGPRIQDNWKDLEYCVRTGEPVFRKRGLAGPFEGRDPQDAENFDAAMANFTRLIAVAVAGAYDFTSFGTVVDVGGGNGALLIALLQANPTLRGIVFDLPAAAERATRHIAASSLTERCRAVGGDFFKAVPAGGDAYLLKHVIHDWNDEQALTILRSCHRVMPASGKLLIVEGLYPPRIDQSLESRGATANDVNMLVNTGGRQRSEAEFRSLYDAAGFTLTRIVPTPARVAVIEGARQQG